MTRKTQPSAEAATQKAEAISSTLAMGRSHHTQGHLKLAEDCYRRVLTLDSNNAEALHLLGVVALQSDATDEAILFMKRANRKMPKEAAILVNLGAALRKANRLQEARETYEEAIKLRPDLIEAHFNLGKVLFDLDEMEDSIAANKKCLELNPQFADAHIGLGNAYKFDAKPEAALAAYKEALRLAPKMGQAYGNIAAVLLDQRKYVEALAFADQGVALESQPGELRFKRSLMALRLGHLATGWRDYESRFFAEKETIARYAPPPPYWTGEDLSDKTLLIWSEQGLGDEILYASMLSEVIAKARACIIECSPRMVPVFARSFPQAKVLRYTSRGVRATPPAEFDRQISIASLGQYLRPDFASFPRHQGFMKADPARAEALRARYQALAPTNLIVGVSWRSKAEGVGRAKSADLSSWAEILGVKNVTFVNLQYGDCAEDLKALKEKLGVEIYDDRDVDSLKSMDDFFAQVAAMDIVITTSNTTVHVAGGLNVPALLLLNSGGAMLWYWFLERRDSPWYPSVKIFRRPDDDDPASETWWRFSAKDIAKELEARVTARRTGAAGPLPE